jgi:hypothetical protein
MQPLVPPTPPKPLVPGVKPPKLPPPPAGDVTLKIKGAVAAALRGLDDLLQRGETAETFAAALRERAQREAPKHKALQAFGADLCRDLGNGRARRFLEEVVTPMQKRQLDARSALLRTNDVFGRDVLRDAQAKSPFGGGVTIAIGMGAALGCVIGFEKCYGVAFTGSIIAPRAFECWSRTVHVGTVEASVSASIEFSLGAPSPVQPDILAKSPLGSKAAGWDGWGLGWSVGGGYGATLGVAVGFSPNFLEPMYSWPLKSLAVQFGGGGGADLGMWLQGAAARELPPLPAKS